MTGSELRAVGAPPAPQVSGRTPDIGELVPSFFAAALNGNPHYAFDSAAGRPMVLLFLGSGRWAPSAAAIALLARHHALFDDINALFFGVTVDPSDAAEGRIAQRVPGIRWFLDYDGAVSRLFGAAGQSGTDTRYAPHWLLLDQTLRVVARAAIGDGAGIFAELQRMMAQGLEQISAPVLTVPRIFEPELCQHLIRLYEQN